MSLEDVETSITTKYISTNEKYTTLKLLSFYDVVQGIACTLLFLNVYMSLTKHSIRALNSITGLPGLVFLAPEKMLSLVRRH